MSTHEERVASALSRINSQHSQNLQRLGDVMGEVTLYDVLTTCRECQTEWLGKAFKPADDKQRWGTCATCLALLDAPKLPVKPKDVDLRPPRRTGEDSEWWNR